MKKAVCIRDWRPAKLKEGNFRGEPDRDNSPAARSSNFIMLRFKFSTKKFAQAARQVSTKKRITKSCFRAFYLSACLSFSSLCPVCMCGCGGDNGGCQPAPPSLPSSPQTQTFPFIEHFPFLPGGLYSCRKLCVAFYLSREKGELASFRKFQPSSTFPFSMFCQLFL